MVANFDLQGHLVSNHKLTERVGHKLSVLLSGKDRKRKKNQWSGDVFGDGCVSGKVEFNQLSC